MEATAAIAIAARLFVLDSTVMIFFLNWGLNFLSSIVNISNMILLTIFYEDYLEKTLVRVSAV